MKKWMIVFLFILILGCGKKENKIPEDNFKNNEIKEYRDSINKYLIYIDADMYLNMINKKENFIVFIGSGSCPACRKFKPIVNRYAKENRQKIYFIDLEKLDNEQSLKIYNIKEINYLPTLEVFKDGELVFDTYGVKDYEFLENLTKEYGLGD